jgi:hypothetical protein
MVEKGPPYKRKAKEALSRAQTDGNHLAHSTARENTSILKGNKAEVLVPTSAVDLRRCESDDSASPAREGEILSSHNPNNPTNSSGKNSCTISSFCNFKDLLTTSI